MNGNLFQDLLARFFNDLREANVDVPSSRLDTLEQRVRERIRQEPAPRVALIGDTGVGKSTTLNSLFNAGQEVGHTRATTTTEYGVRVNIEAIEGERGEIIVYDMPGLSESMATAEQHLATYGRVLPQVDVALWILEAHHRPMEQVQSFLTKDLRRINPDLVNRVVFALNKVDLVHPGHKGWHPLAHLPSEEQQRNIAARIEDVERLVREALPTWDGTVIGYSATEAYNLPQLFAVMMDAVGKKRQWLIAEYKALTDYLEIVDQRYLPSKLQAIRRSTSPLTSKTTNVKAALLEMPEEELQALLAERTRRKNS